VNHVRLDYSKAIPFFGNYELTLFQDIIQDFHKDMHIKSEFGHESLGWVNLPTQYNIEEFEKVKSEAAKVKDHSDILLVIGVGGSYLGARAGIEMLNHSFYNHLKNEQRASPQVFFVGNNLSSTYITDLIDLLQGKDFSLNVISKSGSTLESAIGFRVFRKLIVDKYDEVEARSRIYVTTDEERGTLRSIATIEGYETFVIPGDIGGRFSVLTSVGLFPMAVSGICIDEVMNGAATAEIELGRKDIAENCAYQYAAIRNILYSKGKTIELLASYEPKFQYFSEWWKQLYAESEGKDQKGIFPATATYSTDLHSIGQYVQEGRRNLFETIIKIEKQEKEIVIGKERINVDNLNYLSGKTLNFVNEQALEGALLAHTDGGVPNLVIQVPEISPFSFGYLTYFFQLACAMSGYILGVNPFDQPGVEAYKKNMFVLMGSPGYESMKLELEHQLLSK